MQSLQRIAPHLKQLQEKYKDDKPRLQQETMKFYSENKVNPFASCLPLAAQLPVFLSLFYMLRHDLRVDICGQSKVPCGQIPGDQGESFLFIDDITDKATGLALGVLIVLYVGSQLVSGLITTFTADRTQRIMMLALPFLFVTFIINFDAGLIVYWITTNFWTIGQQLAVKRFLPPPEPLPAGAAVPAGAVAASDGKAKKPAKAAKPAKAEAAAGANGAEAKAPPPGPRKKKKRSGRRR